MIQENKQGITRICYRPNVHCFCPLGKDWYTNEMTIEFVVGDYYPDYCDVEKWLNENIRGRSLIIEDVVSMVYSHFKSAYNPELLKVISCVRDVTSHSPVEVEKC